LSPIIVRREFGAASFGAVYGIASCVIQLATALGPSFYGLLHDAFDGYRVPLLMAAVLDVMAALVVLAGKIKDVRCGSAGHRPDS
jgi:cyanate permease